MIGRLLLRFRRLGHVDALPRRLLSALLHVGAECESLVLRPGEPTLLRRAFLRHKGVAFGHPGYVSQGFRLYKAAAHRLQIGARSCFGENCGLYVHADVRIGDDFIAAPGLTLNNGTHDVTTMEPRGEPLEIGHRVWCGVNVTLIAGARIGDDCVIGANSLVRSEIPSGSLAVGSPARVIRSNIRPGGAASVRAASPSR